MSLNFLGRLPGRSGLEEVSEDGTKFADVERIKSSIAGDLIPSFVISTF